MRTLEGRVAVVTGGAGGLGRAMGERFAGAGMKVVLADVQAEPLARTVAECRDAGMDIIGVPTDVTNYASVEALRDATLSAFGAVHVVCNNAGIGAGAEGRMWEHELNDWKWAIGVNMMGVVHGINAFVPVMLEQDDEGHIVNTSSGNGGVSPLPSTPQYAATKAAVVTITECLYGQLQEVGSKLGASVLFPGPHILRTGLFESWRSRTDEFAKERPRKTPYTTVEGLEAQMKAAGVNIAYTPVEEVAELVVAGLLANEFWMHPRSERGDNQLLARTDSILNRTNPAYLRAVPG
ncbi:MAG: SDR family NAD(P)-dependent oxidoreductase [Actinomycetota bacterium]|nr:SDR family NAD(P)-dependent oxidoreductase [Actinomycetota bacterium]